MPRHYESPSQRFATTIRNWPVCPVLFIDAIVVKVRDGQVTNRPVNAVIGVDVNSGT
jgi:transposase-like protein